jgi:hypothetical protein
MNRILAVCALAAAAAWAQDANAGRALGVVTRIDAAARQVVLKTDAGAEVTVALAASASFRRVAPGETDLRNAAVIALTDIGVGDRVLARGKSAADQKSVEANLIVVMSQGDIAKKQAADRADWDRRGANGVVTAVTSGEVTITFRGKPLTIVPAANAIVRRYAPDSVKFADAKASTLAQIKAGDQVRARGGRTEDGSKLTADEIVSGSFRTIAGVILSMDAQNNEIRINDLETKKPVVVKIQEDSSVKKLAPQAAQLIAARVHGTTEAAAGGGGRGGAGGDLQQMLDRMPAITLADLKNGDAIVVASTVGAAVDQVTAITLLAGVEPILTKPGTRQMSLGDWNMGEIGGGIGEP